MDDGSTASTATLWPSEVSLIPSDSMSDDFPAPGAPDNPVNIKSHQSKKISLKGVQTWGFSIMDRLAIANPKVKHTFTYVMSQNRHQLHRNRLNFITGCLFFTMKSKQLGLSAQSIPVAKLPIFTLNLTVSSMKLLLFDSWFQNWTDQSCTNCQPICSYQWGYHILPQHEFCDSPIRNEYCCVKVSRVFIWRRIRANSACPAKYQEEQNLYGGHRCSLCEY